MRLRRLVLALGPFLSSACFADGVLGACACRYVSDTAVFGDVAALVGMPLTYLCVSAILSFKIRGSVSGSKPLPLRILR